MCLSLNMVILLKNIKYWKWIEVTYLIIVNVIILPILYANLNDFKFAFFLCFFLFFRNKQTQTRQKQKTITQNNKKQDLSKQHYVDDDDYSTLQEPTVSQCLANECSFKHPTPSTLLSSTGQSALAQPQSDVNDIYSMAQEDLPGLLRPNLPSLTEVSISPYACFYGTRNAVTKAGWLDKLSPQG